MRSITSALIILSTIFISSKSVLALEPVVARIARMVQRKDASYVEAAFKLTLKTIGNDRSRIDDFMHIFKNHPDKLNKLDSLDASLAIKQAGPATTNRSNFSHNTPKKEKKRAFNPNVIDTTTAEGRAKLRAFQEYNKKLGAKTYWEKDLSAEEIGRINSEVNKRYADPRVTSTTIVYTADGKSFKSTDQRHARKAYRSTLMMKALEEKSGRSTNSKKTSARNNSSYKPYSSGKRSGYSLKRSKSFFNKNRR